MARNHARHRAATAPAARPPPSLKNLSPNNIGPPPASRACTRPAIPSQYRPFRPEMKLSLFPLLAAAALATTAPASPLSTDTPPASDLYSSSNNLPALSPQDHDRADRPVPVPESTAAVIGSIALLTLLRRRRLHEGRVPRPARS